MDYAGGAYFLVDLRIASHYSHIVEKVERAARIAPLEEPKRRFGSERVISKIFDIPERTLQAWRLHGKGFPFYKLEGHIAYDLDECEAWAKERRVK
jgi:hypothetical protein